MVNYICIEKDVTIIFRQTENKAHCCQKCQQILLHFSQCAPEIKSLPIMVILLKITC